MAALTEIVGTILAYMGDTVSYIVATPILLVPVGIFLIGGCIGLANRLIRG